ncbi:MAG: hypothetical protein ABIS51_16530 [Sphingomonas sp.]
MMLLLPILLTEATATKRAFDPEVFRSHLELSQLCISQEKSNAKIVELYLDKGPNLPNIRLAVTKSEDLFSEGKVSSVEMVSDDAGYVLTANVSGKSAQNNATLTMVVVGSGPENQKWTLSLVTGGRALNFDCVRTVPPPPPRPENDK